MNKEKPSEIITQNNLSLINMILRNRGKLLKMIGREDGRYSTNQIDFLIHGQYISNSNTIFIYLNLTKMKLNQQYLPKTTRHQGMTNYLLQL